MTPGQKSRLKKRGGKPQTSRQKAIATLQASGDRQAEFMEERKKTTATKLALAKTSAEATKILADMAVQTTAMKKRKNEREEEMHQVNLKHSRLQLLMLQAQARKAGIQVPGDDDDDDA